MSDGLRLLVVDDDPMQLELIQRALSYEGFVVTTATTLSDATTAAENDRPDLVLVDANIPGMSRGDLEAFVAARRTRAQVYLFSAADSSQLRALAGSTGAHGWISKSTELGELAKKLRSLHAAAAKEQPAP